MPAWRSSSSERLSRIDSSIRQVPISRSAGTWASGMSAKSASVEADGLAAATPTAASAWKAAAGKSARPASGPAARPKNSR
jgi:hypothetical protein